MTNQDIEKTLQEPATTQIKESDGLGNCAFATRDSRPSNIVEFTPTNGIIRVFEIATKGPTNKGLLNDFSAYLKLAA